MKHVAATVQPSSHRWTVNLELLICWELPRLCYVCVGRWLKPLTVSLVWRDSMVSRCKKLSLRVKR